MTTSCDLRDEIELKIFKRLNVLTINLMNLKLC